MTAREQDITCIAQTLMRLRACNGEGAFTRLDMVKAVRDIRAILRMGHAESANVIDELCKRYGYPIN